MKRLEALLGVAALLLMLGTAGMAVFNMGTLLTKGVAEKAPLPVTETVAALPETTPQMAKATTAPAAAVVSAAAGEKVFKKCKACHSIEKGGAAKTGPNLWAVLGKPVGANEGFDGYSDTMRSMGDRVWDVALLDTFLEKPKALVKGTKMSFAGLKKPEDRQNVIAYMAQNSDTPQTPADLGFATSGAAVVAEAVEEASEPEVVEIDPVPYPEGVTYANPPARSAEDTAEIEQLAAALEALAPTLDYERSRYHPIHFPPAIENASNEECLTCHQEILTHKPRDASPAGVAINDTLAWYQTLDTYEGAQESFHYRHLESDFAKQVMKLECNFCHKGNDPREESPDMMPLRAAFSAEAQPEFTLRKMVNPSETCLRCHGDFPAEVMDLEGSWHDLRADMEYPEAPNGCLSCHAESFRTVRHNVDYLNAANIEELARAGSSDTCYGCHGGRAWYRISYPYPRHAWPGMDEETPEWAIGRPTASDPAYALPAQTK